MGITISYVGKLRDPAEIPALLRDVTARADALGWPHMDMNQLILAKRVRCRGLRGITIDPHPQCEPLHFHFDDQGNFVNHLGHHLLTDTAAAELFLTGLLSSRSVKFDVDPANPTARPRLPTEWFEEIRRAVSCKTQFAGAAVHVGVCDLLREVQATYAPELEIFDESGYFTDGDLDNLRSALAVTDMLVNVAGRAIARDPALTRPEPSAPRETPRDPNPRDPKKLH